MSLRFIHTGDLHFSNIHAYSKLDAEKNLASRFVTQISLFMKICRYALTNKIKYIVVAGDIFNYYNPSSRERKIVFKLFAKMRDQGLEFIIIDGNHDTNGSWSALGYLNDLDITGIKAFSGGVVAYKDFILAPWTPRLQCNDIKEFIKGMDVSNKTLVTHVPMLGGSYGNGFVAESGHNPKEFLDLGFPYIALGDYHSYQGWENEKSIMRYSGSLMAKDFTEFTCQQKYFLDITIENGKVKEEKIKLPIINKLLRYYVSEEKTYFGKDLCLQDDYNNVILEIIYTDNSKYEKDFLNKIAVSYYNKGAYKVLFRKAKSEKTNINFEIEMGDNLGTEDAIKSYCDLKGFDKEYILEIYNTTYKNRTGE